MFIKCEKLNIKHLLLIFFPIFKIIGKYREKNLYLNNLFISPFLVSIGHILCIIFWLSRIKLNKRRNTGLIKKQENMSLSKSFKEKIFKKEKRGLSQFEVVIDENKKKENIKTFKEICFFFVLGIIFFFSNLLRSLFTIYIIKNNVNLIITIFFILILRFLLMSIIGRYIIKEPNNFYFHKIITFILISIFSISYFFIYLEYTKNIIQMLCLLFTSEILYSIFYIGGKEYMQFFYKSPFKLLFFIGVICFLILLILQILFVVYGEGSNLWKFYIYYLKKQNEDTDDYYINILIFFNKLGAKSFYLLFMLLFFFINNFFEWQILSFFSVNCFSSSNFLYVCILPILYPEEKTINIIIYYLLYIIIVFLLLIFNEFIILYCCSLEKHTVHEKKIREMSYYSVEIERSCSEELVQDDLNNNNNNINNNNLDINLDIHDV